MTAASQPEQNTSPEATGQPTAEPKTKNAAGKSKKAGVGPSKSATAGKRAKQKSPRLGGNKDAKLARYRRFVDAYLACGENATQAYKLAGFTASTDQVAGTEGHKLLKKPEVHQMLEKRRAELRAKFAVTTENAFRVMAQIAYFNPTGLFDEKGNLKPLHKLDPYTASALTIETDGQKVLKVRGVTPAQKATIVEKLNKVLRVYDRPPPPPPDDEGKQRLTTDDKETARRMAFLLRAGEAQIEKEDRAKKKATT